MHGPPLTPAEITAKLTRYVRRYEARGLTHSAAINAVAVDHTADPEKVRVLVDAS